MTTRSAETAVDRREATERSDRPRPESAPGRGKRVAAGILGGILLLRGLRRRSVRGMVLSLAGGWLVTRALRGGRGRSGGQAAADAATISRSITVGKPAEELYETWRDPDQLSSIVGHFASVSAPERDRLRWTVHAPGGREVTWDARIVEDEPGAFLRWEATADATVANGGWIRFRPAPGNRGTEVTLSLDVDPPGGAIGDAVLARLDVVPEALAGVTLDRFKALVETGEIPTLERNPSARGRGDLA